MSQPFYKKAGVQAAFVAGIFLLIATILTVSHYTQEGEGGTSNTVKVFGATNSPVTQVNQPSNSTVNNNSGNIAINDNGDSNGQNGIIQIGTNNLVSMQKFSGNFPGQMNIPANIGNLTINNNPIYTNPPDTELKAWVTQIQARVDSASTDITLTKKDIITLTALLTKLDERTEDVQKLRDGRTSFGGIVAGASRTYGADRNNAIFSYVRGNFHLALEQSRKAIDDFESCPSNFVNEMVTILPSSKAVSYRFASLSAQQLGSNELANEYALKAVSSDANFENKGLLVTTLADLAIENFRGNDLSNAFVFFQEAITNYQGIDTSVSNIMSDQDLIRMYSLAAISASQIGKTNDAFQYVDKIKEFSSKTKH